MVTLSGGVGRKKNWRSLPNLAVVTVILVVLWQGWAHMGQLQFLLAIDGLPSHQFNHTQHFLQTYNLLEEARASLQFQLDQSLNVSRLLLMRLEALEKSTLSRDLQLQLTLENSTHSQDRQLQDQFREAIALKEKLETLRSQLPSGHLSEPVKWRPLKDKEVNGVHGFMSDIMGRGLQRGPPELFEFPSNTSGGKHLCFLGNHTKDGSQNSYAYAWQEALPQQAVFLKGTTLISETYWDFTNPWHSMYNLVQFVYWKKAHGCQDAQRLLLYHWAELRQDMGSWISQVFAAVGLPSVPEQMQYDDRPVCFEDAVLSRSGIGGVPAELMRDIYREVRCQARRYCKVPISRPGPTDKQSVRVTLMVRTGGRAYKNLSAWEEVVRTECAKVEGCEWGPMVVSSLTFCEQVAIMSKTDILVSVHGAQLTNMIFMSPAGQILEMFPKGWLELAGHGQYIYRLLADWVGLYHKDYWRDPNTPDCPNPENSMECFSFFKDQPVGIDAAHISGWLSGVIAEFNEMQTELSKPEAERHAKDFTIPWDSDQCDCSSNGSFL